MTKHFLLAEDDEDDVELIQTAIKEADLPIVISAVLTCDNIISNLSPEKLPELVIIDTTLPGKSALECIAAIRSNFKPEQLPVVVLSTAIPDSLKVKGYDAGFNLMLEKPDTFVKIQKLVKRLYAIDWSTKPSLTPDEFNNLEV